MRLIPIALVTLATLGAAPRPADPDPAAIVAANKAATGGDAWDAIEGSWEEGVHLGIPYQTWIDLKRYGTRVEASRGGATMVRGFDGTIVWEKGPDGKVTRSRDPAEVREAIVTAFVSNNGQFFPERFPASARWLRAVRKGGQVHDVIEFVPVGGRELALWFSRDTHLIGAIEDTGGKPPVTVSLSDYRQVGPVRIAHAGVMTLADGKEAGTARVTRVELRHNDAALFAPPAEQ